MTKKITVNLTDEEYNLLRWMSENEKITISELLLRIFSEHFEQLKEQNIDEFNKDKSFVRSETIGQKISRLRQEQKMSQAKLGEMCGVITQQISDWENGKRIPKTSSVKKLASALKVSVDELI